MARLQTSGDISLQDLISFFGGGNKLTDFYRGGGLVKSTRTVSTTMTMHGEWSAPVYRVETPVPGSGPNYWFDYYGTSYWDGVVVSTYSNPGFYHGSYQYEPSGTLQGGVYPIRRRSWWNETVSYDEDINLNVPSSGDIKLTDFYGAYDS